jgi:hypothetical protein
VKVLFVLTLGVALAATPAIAQNIWFEVGDAGDLPGIHQVPAGTDPFTAIHGFFTGDALTADMYCVEILDPMAFGATTTGGTTIDTQLWLFDMSGMGITFNDDDPAGGLQSRITGQFVPGPGEYLLAISAGYTYDAVNAAGQEIWLDSPYNVERMPDGPGAPGPITGWIGSPTPGEYIIALQGASFCEVTAVESATWGTIKAMYR